LHKKDWKDVITLFVPKHYPAESWLSYLNRGFRLNRFLARPASVIKQMNAADFLRAGWEEMFINDSEKITDCCLASIVLPQKAGVIRLKCDEDYFYISNQINAQTNTPIKWQLTKCFEGFRLDELWMNMIKR